MKLLRDIITQTPDEFSKKHWEIICMSLASWLLTVSKSLNQALLKRDFTVRIHKKMRLKILRNKYIFFSLQTFYFTIHVIRLFQALEGCFNMIDSSSSSASREAREEWKSVFAKDVHLTLFKVVHCISQYTGKL